MLGSRSTDTLAWVGPERVVAGSVLPIGRRVRSPAAVDVPQARRGGALRVLPGPRAEWFDDDAFDRLVGGDWLVGPDSNRIGMRLTGPVLSRAAAMERAELPSEGMVLGAVQVPPDGQPVVFLADHPPTGGYPVIGLVHLDDLWRCAQVRPGEPVRFTRPVGWEARA